MDNCIVDGKDMLKVLDSNTIYPFYQFYDFLDKNFEKIKLNEDQMIDLYSFNKTTSVNISAIVGENGSGKSSLIELFIMANYNLGCHAELLDECICEKNDKDCECDKKENRRTLASKTGFKLEILFSSELDELTRLKFESGKITRSNYIKETDSYILGKESEIKKIDLQNFCYSIVVNYSHHALNAEEIGTWINPLFHKNDGYQTPIVINPMRNDGNIDINREKELLNDRLLSNLLEPLTDEDEINSLRNLGNTKIATDLIFHLNSYKILKKFISEDEFFSLSNESRVDKAIEIRTEQIKDLIERPSESKSMMEIKKFFNLDVKRLDLENDSLVQWACIYLFSKGHNISEQYNTYKIENTGFDYKFLKEDTSHIAFKIKRVIYFLKHYTKWKILLDKGTAIRLNDISELLKEIRSIEKKDLSVNYVPKVIELLPPSFFKVDIKLNDNLTFEGLSSGERQKILAMSSIIYHIINLNSVKSLVLKDGSHYLKYQNINIIFDEIELYFHPDWQRTFIYDLLEYLQKINADHLSTIKGLNFIFITHSPFILSDIPAQNILRLKINSDTKRAKSDPIKTSTFGANIHELLADSFFMKSTIGEYSKQKIEEIIHFHASLTDLTEEKTKLLARQFLTRKKEFNFIVKNIGEDVIREILGNHLKFIEETLEL